MRKFRAVRPRHEKRTRHESSDGKRSRADYPRWHRDVAKHLDRLLFVRGLPYEIETSEAGLHLRLTLSEDQHFATLSHVIAILRSTPTPSAIEVHPEAGMTRDGMIRHVASHPYILGPSGLYSVSGASQTMVIDPRGDPDAFAAFSTSLGLRDLLPERPAMTIVGPRPVAPETRIGTLLMTEGITGVSADRARQDMLKIIAAIRDGRPYVVIRANATLDPDTTAWPAEKFMGRKGDRKEDIVAFLRRVWKPWIEKGATLNDLRREDRKAEKAVANYKIRGRDLPEDIALPRMSDLSDALADQIRDLPDDVLLGIGNALTRIRKSEKPTK